MRTHTGPAVAYTSRGIRLSLFEVMLGVGLILGVPLLNLCGLLSDYSLNLFGKYLALAILAASKTCSLGIS